MAPRSPYCIELSELQRATLERLARTRTAPYREVLRAKIVLLAAAGVLNKEIAARLATSPQVVHKWRKRFFEEGLAGLEDRPRSGRPPVFSPLGGGGGQGPGL